jgi:alpha-tubulin suppressor-like RCC1 family protein
LTDITSIATFSPWYAMALKSDGTVWAWGTNYHYGFGDGTKYVTYTTPIQLPLSGITKIAAGLAHFVALGADQRVWGWGSGSDGRLGYGGNVDKEWPVLAQITGVKDISAGEHHTLAVKNDGTVWAWGNNQFLQLGVPILTNTLYLPVHAEGISNAARVFGAPEHSMALTTDGSLWVWGDNLCGEYGDGSVGNPNWVKVQVPNLPPITAVAVGDRHVLAATE